MIFFYLLLLLRNSLTTLELYVSMGGGVLIEIAKVLQDEATVAALPLRLITPWGGTLLVAWVSDA